MAGNEHRGIRAIGAHIPATGPLDPAAVEESFDRATAYFTNPMVSTNPDGTEKLSDGGRARVDSAMATYLKYVPANPIVVEGYSTEGTVGERFRRARSRAGASPTGRCSSAASGTSWGASMVPSAWPVTASQSEPVNWSRIEVCSKKLRTSSGWRCSTSSTR